MIFKVLTNRDTFIFSKTFIEAGFNFDIISNIPDKLDSNEVLVLDITGSPSSEIVELLRLKSHKFIAIIDSYTDQGIPEVVKFGGGIYFYSSLGEKEIPHVIRTAVEDIKVRDISHQTTHNEQELFRFIGRLVNAEKSVLIKILYGATNETTLDVNLNRLRKKLKDPEIGNDFFRVVSKNKRLHLVSKIRGYKPFPEI